MPRECYGIGTTNRTHAEEVWRSSWVWKPTQMFNDWGSTASESLGHSVQKIMFKNNRIA